MPASNNTFRHMLRKAALWAALLLVLGLVFLLYLQPQFAVRMADQLWACF